MYNEIEVTVVWPHTHYVPTKLEHDLMKMLAEGANVWKK